MLMFILAALAATPAAARQPEFYEWQAVQETLSRIGPKGSRFDGLAAGA